MRPPYWIQNDFKHNNCIVGRTKAVYQFSARSYNEKVVKCLSLNLKPHQPVHTDRTSIIRKTLIVKKYADIFCRFTLENEENITTINKAMNKLNRIFCRRFLKICSREMTIHINENEIKTLLEYNFIRKWETKKNIFLRTGHRLRPV